MSGIGERYKDEDSFFKRIKLLICISLCLFGGWFVLIFPLGGEARVREALPVNSKSNIFITYPKYIYLQEKTSFIEFSFNDVETDLDIEIPDELIFVDITPQDILKSSRVLADGVGLTLSLEENSLLPDTIEKYKVSIEVQNAGQSMMTWYKLLLGRSYPEFRIKKNDLITKDVIIPLHVEAVFTARFRKFAKENSFLGTAPLLLSVIGLLGQQYIERKKRLTLQAKKRLRGFRDAIEKDATFGKRRYKDTEDAYNALKKVEQYVDIVEMRYVETIFKFLEKENYENITISQLFDIWPNTLAAVLEIAFKSIDENRKWELYRYLRIFPREKLSPSVANRFDLLMKNVDLPNLQGKTDNYFELPFPQVGGDERDFFYFYPDADDKEEQRCLFSSKEMFWRGHHLYRDVLQSTSTVPWIIWGERGAGKTALALALTRHNIGNPDTLGCYLAQTLSIVNVRASLALRLLKMVCFRTTYLIKLERNEFNLLAEILVKALNRSYVLAKLNNPDDMQFDSAPSEEAKLVWKKQALVGTRLLSGDVEEVKENTILSPDNWLRGFEYIIQRLGLTSVFVAIDLKTKQGNEHFSKNYLELISWLYGPGTIPVRVVITLPTSEKEKISIPKNSRLIEENLIWTTDELKEMFIHRAVQNGNLEEFVNTPALDKLISFAKENPMELARSWLYIRESFPDKKIYKITPDIIIECNKNRRNHG